MPIVDVCTVMPDASPLPAGTAKALANSIAAVFNVGAGRVWLRLQVLPQSHYAENGPGEDPSPVFVKVIHADLKPADQLAQEAMALTQAVAACLGRNAELIHVEYAPAGRGRMAFGGNLVH